MYTSFDIVGLAEDGAKDIIIRERTKYGRFLAAIERCASSRGYVVGGITAIRFLINETPDHPPIDMDSFQYDFFSEHALSAARSLADAMYEEDPDGLGLYAASMTRVSDYHMTVSVYGRDIANITQVKPRKGIKFSDVMSTVSRPSQFASDNGKPIQMKCISPCMQLISIYSTLCDPSKVKEWDKYLRMETNLRQIFTEDLMGKLRSKGISLSTKNYPTIHTGTSYQRLFSILAKSFLDSPDRVLIGEAASKLLREDDLGTPFRMQMISRLSMENEASTIEGLAKSHSIDIVCKENNPSIATDVRLTKITVYLINGSKRDPIMDIYNGGLYSLIPYRNLHSIRNTGLPNIRIGTPFVLMKYCLVDILSTQLLARTKALDEVSAQDKIAFKISEYMEFSVDIDRQSITSPNISPITNHYEDIFPISSYIGRLEQPDLAMRRKAIEGKSFQFYPPYFPAMQKKIGGTYMDNQSISVDDQSISMDELNLF